MTSRHLKDVYSGLAGGPLRQIARLLEKGLGDILGGQERVDRISVRVKGVESFMKKAEKRSDGVKKYEKPLREIQDQIGARVVVYYLADVERIKGVVDQYYSAVERRHLVPESVSEFGYDGFHYVLLLPQEVIPDDVQAEALPGFFELQIKTLFQHAWGEAGHDLAYKPESALSVSEKRQVAFTAAQAWGADMIFDKLCLKGG